MMGEQEILEHYAGLQRETLHVWIQHGWVIPERDQEGYRFREIDVARVGLIYEFSTDLDLDDDVMGIVLPLLDQVHGLRHQLRSLAGAVNAQPEDVRQRIAQALAQERD